MRRYWLEQPLADLDQIELSEDVFHHIAQVCRTKLGERFELLTSEGKAYLVEFTEIGKRSGTVKILEQRALPEPPEPRVHLAVAMSKYPTMDSIVEKAVELGAHSVQPVYSDYSFIRSDSKFSENKYLRWQKIVTGASQQTARGYLMAVHKPVPLAEQLERINLTPDEQGLFLYEGGAEASLRAHLDSGFIKDCKDLWVFIGSEGGFSSQEVELFTAKGLPPLTLGDQILRVETACLALLSIIKYELNQFQ